MTTGTLQETNREAQAGDGAPLAPVLVLGDEAIALGAMDAGIGGAFAYPGTPSTEIYEYVEAHADRGPGRPPVVARWSTNEKVAYEEALGMSFAGKRALVSMKHVGLNVAADPFMNSALTGVNGALVLVVADDPGMHSSQNEQDTRYYGEFARLPVLEPSDQQQCYDMTREAFELSEALGLPVILRIVTRVAHSRAVVHRAPPVDGAPPADAEERQRPENWTLVPSNARRRNRRLLDLQPELLARAEASPYNQLRLQGRKGILCSGIACNYVHEALGEEHDWSTLEIRHYPPPRDKIRALVEHCDEVFVVEEGYPFLETRLNGLLGVPGRVIRGKTTGDLPDAGELSPEIVGRALGVHQGPPPPPPQDLPARPPALCRGCPHIDTFHAMLEATADFEHPHLLSDIGCYTLGALPPYEAVHTAVDMGSSISMAVGAARAGLRPILCTIGDSTFTHSGMTGLLDAIREDADITVLILDNSTVAMTGTQQTMAHGEELVEILRGLGVNPEHLHVFEPFPKRHTAFAELLDREIAHRGLSVIVSQRPCIHVKRKERG